MGWIVLGNGIPFRRGGGKQGQTYWATHLFGEDDLALKFDSRSGSQLVDSIGAETADILIKEFLSSDGSKSIQGDKTRAAEKLFDGSDYTIYFRLKQNAAVTTTTYEIVELGKQGNERGIEIRTYIDIVRIEIHDGTNQVISYPLYQIDNNILPLDYVDVLMQINFAAKTFTIWLYDKDGALINTDNGGNKTLAPTVADISSIVFNSNNNGKPYVFRSNYFVITNFKKFNALVNYSNCLTDNYITALQIHYPMISGLADVSGNSNHLTTSTNTIADYKYAAIHNSWALDYGYDFERSSLHPASSAPDYLIPYDVNGDSEAVMKTAIINEVAGNVLHNLADSKLRFTNAFFDRSNATIWKDAARQNKFARIVVTGTGGTADININGVVKTITFATSIDVSTTNFINDNQAYYTAIGVVVSKIFDDTYELSFNAINENTISVATITNTSGDLTGTVTQSGYYDSSNVKDFHISELNQRTLMSWLNDGYRGRLYVNCESKNHNGTYKGSIEERERTLLKGIYLYNTDYKGADQLKILTYTGDKFAAVSETVFDADGYVKLGHLQCASPSLCISIDDAYDDCFTGWKPFFAALEIECSTNAHAGLYGQTDGGNTFMTLLQLQGMRDAGWEVASHNYLDNDYATMTFAQIEEDVLLNKTTLAEGGFTVAGMIPNRLSTDNPTTHYLSWKHGFKYCRSHTGRFKTVHGANPKHLDRHNLSAMALDTGSPTYLISSGNGTSKVAEIAAIKAQLDLALSDNRIVILYFHHYTGTYTEYFAALTECVNYAKGLGIGIKTLDQALDSCKYL